KSCVLPGSYGGRGGARQREVRGARRAADVPQEPEVAAALPHSDDVRATVAVDIHDRELARPGAEDVRRRRSEGAVGVSGQHEQPVRGLTRDGEVVLAVP